MDFEDIKFSSNMAEDSSLCRLLTGYGMEYDEVDPDIIVLSSFAEVPRSISHLIGGGNQGAAAKIALIFYEIGCSIVAARLAEKPIVLIGFSASLAEKPIVLIGAAFHYYHAMSRGRLEFEPTMPRAKLGGDSEKFGEITIPTMHTHQVNPNDAEFMYESVLLSSDGRVEIVQDVDEEVLGFNFHPDIHGDTKDLFKEYLLEFCKEVA